MGRLSKSLSRFASQNLTKRGSCRHPIFPSLYMYIQKYIKKKKQMKKIKKRKGRELTYAGGPLGTQIEESGTGTHQARKSRKS